MLFKCFDRVMDTRLQLSGTIVDVLTPLEGKPPSYFIEYDDPDFLPEIVAEPDLIGWPDVRSAESQGDRAGHAATGDIERWSRLKTALLEPDDEDEIGMTDRQLELMLRMILDILKNCDSLDDASRPWRAMSIT